jgi:flagellar hook protein FlgE
MFTAFQTALSALNATSAGIDATSNNLANLNTTGYKATGVSFQDLVTQSFGTVSHSQGGNGVARANNVRAFTQGAIATTSGPLDAAINGDGFFLLRGSNNAQEFTRAGNFQSTALGVLTTVSGQRVQGWTQLNANGTVNTNGPIGDIQLPTGNLRQPLATQNFSLDLNLNSNGQVGQPTGSFSQPIQVVDSLGNTQTLTVAFTKTGSNAWSYAVTAPASALTTAPTAPLKTGTLTFDATGKLLTPAAVAPATNNDVAIAVTGLADGAADLSINWNLNNPLGASRLTQIAQPSQVSANTQDGTEAATLVSVNLGDGGTVNAHFSNGQDRVVGQLAIASIRNPDSLAAVGNNNFEVSAQTAAPVIGAAETGGRGKVLGSSLESSTVDIAKEFTNLIIYQRGYQANAKVINTEDQLSQETIALKQ